MDDLKAQIAACCRKLRLSSNLAERAMTTEGATNQEYLYQLLKGELSYRMEKRITKYLNTAGFPKLYSREQFRTDEIGMRLISRTA